MGPQHEDIYTEPSDVDPDTLRNLGPLGPMAGTWESAAGVDVHPVADGAEEEPFVERIELEPIDPQTNGPQLLYGLRYHTRVVRPGEVETFHDQVGYWLWEPATGTVTLTLAIPRAQVALATGRADRDATEFEVAARLGSSENGICSGSFLDRAFRTLEFRMRITIHRDGTWQYDEDTVMAVQGKSELFHHRDRNRLRRIAEPTPNPLARAVGG
jgi:hypothetical protein